ILVVEDEPLVREITIKSLTGQGYIVLSACNGREAVALAAEYGGPIHLLLTDVVMPEMGGKQLAEALRETRPDTKVLYTSGYADNAVIQHDLVVPGFAFLQKPFAPSTLSRKVRDMLGPPVA